jgi:hypothetical protein
MQEDDIPKEGYEFGELHIGRRCKRKNIEAERRESCSDLEGREPCTLVRILEVPYLGGEEEELQSIPIIEDLASPTQQHPTLNP